MFGFGKKSGKKIGNDCPPTRESWFYANVFSRFVQPVSIGPDPDQSKGESTTEAGMTIAGALGMSEFFGRL